ncbi:hypothetical protein CLIB1423_11S01860 [[Candida] railenensis]|uniref:Uncharacterized protein n=1 Tax=[Candida] railenensis TaxID=45579 RepID=A0A9P0VZ00_9ASCO|nr:hypothetical protein CLIB1423_11S01860 [[Candida] railenensis]
MFLALVYLRGSKLFTQDFAFISNLVKSGINFDGWSSIFENDSSAADYLDSVIRWGYSKANGGIWNLLTESLFFLSGGNQSRGNKGNAFDSGFGFEFDERAFEYAKQFAKENLDKDTVKDFVAGNMENIEHMIRDSGIDVNQVLNNFMQHNR